MPAWFSETGKRPCAVVWSVASAAFAVACGVNPFGSSSDPQGASTASSSTTNGSADTGVACGTDAESGVRLCLGTTECADTKLDLDAFPGCGFRTTHGSYDLECLCNGSALCPVGVAASCDELPGLFAHKSLADICNQAGDGACKEVGKAGGPSSTGTSSTCDRGCAAECGSSPPCLQACGC
jgi:hypothetical protein